MWWKRKKKNYKKKLIGWKIKKKNYKRKWLDEKKKKELKGNMIG